MKNFNGKAIYNPSGKAGEYAEWACNFYVGCSNGCEYCYCKKGILKPVMGQDTPQLKKCFRDDEHALEVFEKELKANLPELQKHGLFFSFTTDPMLEETRRLTTNAWGIAIDNKVPVKILTKRADWVDWELRCMNHDKDDLALTAFGFTLTGHDELEPNASTNAERIEAMHKLHNAGFKTWASIEPVIDFESSLQMLWGIRNCCDLAKIGLMSGKKYDKEHLRDFIRKCMFWGEGERMAAVEGLNFKGFKIYFKDSLLKQAGIDRDTLPNNCVGRDYNIFNIK